MRGLPALSTDEAFRVRRWDALVLGGALPGLVAAVRLGQRGLRVLVLEEALEGGADPPLREPFLLVDPDSRGLFFECLRALGLALIDQRRFGAEEVPLQICDAEARIDLGLASHTVDELESWGLAPREAARHWMNALEAAARAEGTALLETTLARSARKKAREVLSPGRRPSGAAPEARGWPSEVEAAPEPVRALLEAPVRALSNLGVRPPSSEARARLVGGLLRGGVAASTADGGLRGLLRRRIEALYGELRPLRGAFRLVSVAQQPGLATEESKEIWTGRALVLNAPLAALAAAAEPPVPDLLKAPPIERRRHTLRFLGPRELLPPSMGDRLVWRDADGESVALRVLRRLRRDPGFELLASAVVPTGNTEACCLAEERIARALRDLLPFSEGSLERRTLAEPRWDSDALLADPAGAAWPAEPELRLSSRPSVYSLDRAPVAGLGGEGELWLGWRGGDAIAEELA